MKFCESIAKCGYGRANRCAKIRDPICFLEGLSVLHLGRTSMLLRTKRSFTLLLALVVLCSAAASGSLARSESTRAATAVFAGGCFWGVDAVFRHVKGVSKVVSNTQEEARTRQITKQSAPEPRDTPNLSKLLMIHHGYLTKIC